MIPEGYREFFTVSTGASAALIGLLFVAIAVEPKSIVGEESRIESRSTASSAFIALSNVFFISLTGTVPHTNVGTVAVGMAILLGFTNTLGIGLSLLREWSWERRRITFGLGLLLGSFVVYGLELWYGWQFREDPGDVGYLDSLVSIMIIMYGLALARAWDVLGARDEGFLSSLLALRREYGKRSRKPEASSEGDLQAEDEERIEAEDK